MFFTQNDYKKIEEYLRLNSKKDTDFKSIDDTMIKPTDWVAIVLNNASGNHKNVKVQIKDLTYDMFKSLIDGTDGRFSNIVDSIPTKDSVKLVRSNGIWHAINDPDVIDTHQIKNNSVTTLKLADGSVTTIKIADGAVTNIKLADGSVSWEKFSAELQNLIASISSGGIALAQSWGNSDLIGITQRFLTEEHNAVWNMIYSLINDKATVSLTVTPSVVHVGSTNTITLKATTDTAATEIKITGGASVITGSGKSIQGTDTVQLSVAGEKAYTAEFTINGLKKSTTAKLTAVNKIYYGSGDAYTDATSVASARKTPVDTYNVTVGTSGKSIFFVIPATMTINKATLSGFDFPLDAPVSVEKDNVSYKSYKSSNTMDAGTYQIVIS